jgi:hypothetical protein
MVRHTSIVVSVPSQADTQLSPMGVAWSTNALIACSLRMGSQEPSMRHGLIVLCCPGNGPETPSLQEAKRRYGGRENRTRVKPSTRVFRPTPYRTQNTKPTSAPTSTRDGPHVGTHICARPLSICYFRSVRTYSVKNTNDTKKILLIMPEFHEIRKLA